MKKLYIKQQLFSAIDKFTVKNEYEEDRFLVEGDRIVVGGKKLHIKDMLDNEIAMVQQKLLSLRPRFFVFKNGEQVAEIKKKFALFGSKYLVEGPGWEIKGSLMGHDYAAAAADGGEVLRVHKVWRSWGDSYELDIADGTDEILALSTVLAIDLALEAEAESAAAAAGSNG